MVHSELNIDNYLVTPLFILLLIGGIVGFITFLFLLRYRQTPGVKYWLIWQITVPVWAFTYAFEFSSTDLATKIFWSKLSYVGIVYCTVSYLFFSLEFTANKRFLKRYLVVSMYALSTIFLLFPFTNELHHLLWKSYSINPLTNATDYVYGPFFWVIFVFSYLTLTAGIVNILIFYFRLPSFYKRQIGLLFFASLLPPVGNVMYVFHLNPVPGFDWTPLTFLMTGLLIAINISQFRMFDLVPFARNKLIDIIPDAILVLDRSMRIADYNPAMENLIDPGRTEIIGAKIEDVFPHRARLIGELIIQEDAHREVSKEVNGETFYYDLHVTGLTDYSGQETGKLIVIKDVTRHIQAEEKIRDANELLKAEIEEKEKLIADLDAFSHTVAHDLKNMLGVIVSASGLVKSGITDGMDKADILEINDMITESATKTMHITRELLTLASVRQQEIRTTGVNMQRLVSDSLTRLKSMVDEYKATIKLPSDWPEVLGYEAWLEEVWINYLSNAMKYGGSPPVIEIGHAILPGEQVKYWIRDNGHGLTKEQIGLLFHKFTRLETLRVEGHGLGLSIVRRIIEKLGGEVGVESTNIPGEGSLFFFVLPMAKKT